MVLIRRKDKRKGNRYDNYEETGCSMPSNHIEATKGVRSLRAQVSHSGRFAADMRVAVGGYGPPGSTLSSDHPWQTTKRQVLDEIYNTNSLHDEEKDTSEVKHGESRASKRRQKKKQKAQKHQVSIITPKENKNKELDNFKETAKDSKSIPPLDNETRKQKKIENKKEIDLSEVSKTEKKKKKISSKINEKKMEKTVPQASVQPDLNVKDPIMAQEEREILAKSYEEQLGELIETPSGLQITDQYIGKGPVPKIGQLLTVKYRGKLDKHGKAFGKGMLSFKFGKKGNIEGWEEGMGTMRSGGKRLLIIPPSLGYGGHGKGDKIPPNSTLYFEIELIRIGKRQRENDEEIDFIQNQDSMKENHLEIPLPRSFTRKKESKKNKMK